MIVISDTSPISGLYLIGQIELLPKLFGKVIVPTTVAKELERLSFWGHEMDIVLKSNWISIETAIDSPKLEELRSELDPGEAEAIALATVFKADLLIIDELKGRRIAVKEGLKIIGILGILLEAKEMGFLEKVQPKMDQLRQQAKFRISPALYNAVLIAANEF